MWHWKVWPVVSELTVDTGSQPVVLLIVASGVTTNATVTSVVYQPSEHPPGLHDHETGSALAAGTKTTSGAQTSRSKRKVLVVRLIRPLPSPRARASIAQRLQARRT